MKKKKLKKFIGEDQDEISKEELDEEEYYTVTKNSFKEMTNGGSKMILMEPRAYSESQQIADYLKARNTVVVNLKRVTPDKAKRIVDFLSGTLYAINGDLQKLGNGIFLCAPNNVNIEGKMSSDDKKGSKKDDDLKNDNEYDW